jgi:hypothetical protein
LIGSIKKKGSEGSMKSALLRPKRLPKLSLVNGLLTISHALLNAPGSSRNIPALNDNAKLIKSFLVINNGK